MPTLGRYCSLCKRVYGTGHLYCPLDGNVLNDIPTDLPDISGVVNGRYLILSKLGTGGMGTIFKSYDIPLRREVALKILKPSLAMRERAVQRFFEEARIARDLHHPNIVELYDFGVSKEGYMFLAMELLPGITLADLLSVKGRLKPGESLLIARDISDALQHAHQAGLVHRDLKPENLFLATNEDQIRVKVLDFGVAAVIGQKGRGGLHTGEVLGTPEYMSPEQVIGDVVDIRSDLYSLGIVLYEMLSGAPPFVSPDATEVMRMHLEKEPPPLPPLAVSPSIAVEIEKILGELLSKQRDNRPKSAQEVRKMINGVIDRLMLEDAKTVDAVLLRQTLLPMRKVSGNIGFDEEKEKQGEDAFEPDTEPAGILGPSAPIPWTVERKEPIQVVSQERIVVTLLHIEVDYEEEEEGLLSLRSLFSPEMIAFQAEVMAKEGTVLYDSGSEVRVAFGLYSRLHPPWITGVRLAKGLLQRAEKFRQNISREVPIRIGIATNTIPTNLLNTSHPDQALRGSPVDVAVRLARMALPGQALVDEKTRDLCIREARFLEVGKIMVRGSEKAQRVFSLSLSNESR